MQAFELDDPRRLRQHLARSRQVYEVRADGHGGHHWQSLARGDDAAFSADALRAAFSPKRFFFAERERLFSFDGGHFYASLPQVEPQVLFGVNACDLRALAYQDRFFAEDAHYQARRRQTLLVGLDCLDSCAGGFCHTVGGSSAVDQNQADLILHGRDRHWTLLVASSAGEQALQGLTLTPASEGWALQRQADAARVAAEQGAQAHIQAGIDAINAGTLQADTWEALGLRCLGCSGCTSACPTCSCSAPWNEVGEGGAVEQLRVWDSCLYAGFQQEASGHNPSASPGQRVQRFWYHKFGEAFRQRFDSYGCVGCGRCERVCPGGIGVHGVMHRIAGQ